MQRSRLGLLLLIICLAIVALGLLVRYYLYPLVADRLPWEKDTEIPADEEPLPYDPSQAIEGVYKVHFIDVGQGDAILVQTPEKNLLIDGGSQHAGLIGYLHQWHIDTLHIVVSTHAHADHIGGLPSVLRNFPVLEVIDPGLAHTTRLFTSYLELIDSLDIPFAAARAGMQRRLGDQAMLEILHPAEPADINLDDASVVARVSLNGISFFFSGDIGIKSEHALLGAFNDIQSHILKVAHHGSTTSTSELFLDAVRPEVAVISCGKDNQYKFPHPEALHKLQQRNIATYRTDVSGSIVIYSDGHEYYLMTEQGGIESAPGPGNFPLARINLNTASLDELLRIVHVGPARAQQLIDMRPIRSLEELMRIQGIDQNRLDDIITQNLAFV